MFINENVKTFQPKARDPTASGSSPCAANFPAEQEQSISHWKRSAFATPFTGSMDTPLAMDWAMKEAAAAPETPASSVCCEILPDIDPRLLAAEGKII